MHGICSLIAVILGARRGLKMHSKNTQVLNWQWPQSAVFSLRLGQSSMERAVAENVCSILSSTPFYSKVLQIWSILAQRASPHLGHLSQLWRWLQSEQLDGCSPTWCLCGKEKFTVGFPGCSGDIFCCQSSGLLCGGIIWCRATPKHMALDWASSWLLKRRSVLVMHGNTLM